MDSSIFKHKQNLNQHQHFSRRNSSNNNNNNSSSSKNNNTSISSHNNNNQNSIFILNTATNNILPNNPQLYYSDLNDNNVVPSSANSSVWSSASSTMCSPAAHAIQKFFNCSSNSLKFNYGNDSGIESKGFKSNSEILKKKSKFWKYLEAEANEKNNQQGIEDGEGDANASANKLLAKSFKCKTKCCSTTSYESDNRNQPDLSELLEYSCSLCDNCRCMDCQIGYFDCENSDDSNSEYSFHLSAYEEDEEQEDESDIENITERPMELKSYENCCYRIEKEPDAMRKLSSELKLIENCNVTYCECPQSCQQCFIDCSAAAKVEGEIKKPQRFLTTPDH